MSQKVLNPIERIGEILFGLIMVLTFTGSLSVSEGGEYAVGDMLLAAVGCNLAWGVIDALMYVMSSISSRVRLFAFAQELNKRATSSERRSVLEEMLPDGLTSMLQDEHIEALASQVRERSVSHATPPVFVLREWQAALSIFALVFLSAFPPLIPFMIFGDPLRAMRISNLVAVSMMVGLGYWLGIYSHARRPWLVALLLAVVGGTVVSWTIALGG